MADTRCIGVVSDGKPGHLNQSLGLAEALQRLRPALGIREFPALRRGAALRRLLGAAPENDGQVALLIAAGHGTQLTLLALKRRFGCPAIVLMRPGLPAGLFDLVIQPRHDRGSESARRWLSDGPLNRMRPAPRRGGSGLILVGGPSPHYAWDSAALLRQLSAICNGYQTWELSGSRRTPDDFLSELAGLGLPGLTVHAAQDLPAGWLGEALPRADQCWVSPDSASMVYEALTAGCAVGVLELPARAGSRVAGGIRDLAGRGLVTAFADFRRGAALATPEGGFAEADRCARRLVEQGWV